MGFDSEDRRSDFAAWAEEMSYEEEKEIKRQEKLQLKEAKKAAKRSKKRGDSDNQKAEKPSDKADREELKKDSSEENSNDSSIGYKPASIEDADNNTETSEVESDGKDTSADEEDYNPDYKKVKKKKESGEVNIVKELLSLIIYIGVVIILCYCIITYVGQRTTVNGHSMENTLQDGDNLWIDKFSYHFHDPQRFDVIVFPYDDETYFIKRVIGLPGETVKIQTDGSILINGQRLAESYGKEVIADPGTAGDEKVLGEDEFFVLGDNRNDSRDSRWEDVGNIDRENIIGRAVFRLTPFSKFGKIE